MTPPRAAGPRHRYRAPRPRERQRRRDQARGGGRIHAAGRAQGLGLLRQALFRERIFRVAERVALAVRDLAPAAQHRPQPRPVMGGVGAVPRLRRPNADLRGQGPDILSLERSGLEMAKTGRALDQGHRHRVLQRELRLDHALRPHTVAELNRVRVGGQFDAVDVLRPHALRAQRQCRVDRRMGVAAGRPGLDAHLVDLPARVQLRHHVLGLGAGQVAAKKPCSPSKTVSGPWKPSAASRAANSPAWAARAVWSCFAIEAGS
nr:hypothetical protein [Marinicauda algicola]